MINDEIGNRFGCVVVGLRIQQTWGLPKMSYEVRDTDILTAHWEYL